MLSASILISIFEFRTWITKVHTYLFERIDENLKHKNWTYWQPQKKCIHSLVNIWILFSNWESFLWENAKNSVQSQTAVFNKVFPARPFYYYTQSTSIHTTAMMSGIPQLSSHKLPLRSAGRARVHAHFDEWNRRRKRQLKESYWHLVVHQQCITKKCEQHL